MAMQRRRKRWGDQLGIAVLTAAAAWGQGQWKGLNPTVQKIVAEISADRIAATMKKLESFGTRDSNSSANDPTHGIGAARMWIYDEFRGYSPRLRVRFDTYPVKKSGRLVNDTDIVNVVAELPGKRSPEVQLLVGGHYDSMAFVLKAGATRGEETSTSVDWDATAKAPLAPGVSDNASGTAAVMEMARVMSQYEFDKTLVFVAFAAEEQGLIGSTLHAQKAKKDNVDIEAMLNNDIIGSDAGQNGLLVSDTVHVFSDEPMDSGSRALARYIRDVGERYVPQMRVNLVFRRDRFGRGGDHTPFHTEGFAAVRFTSPAEHLLNQHSPADTFVNASPGYTSRVARVNAATLACLAQAPRPPEVSRISRGTNRTDTILRWKTEGAEADVAGYALVLRSTLAPFWEKEIYVGKTGEFTLQDTSIDDVVAGVKAIDQDGFESLVTSWVPPPFPTRKIELVEK
jgi:hypothetical protein